MTNRNILVRESTKNEKLISKLPELIHENNVAFIGLWSCCKCMKTYKESRNDMPTVPQAIIDVSDFDKDLLARPVIRNPRSGRIGIRYIMLFMNVILYFM